MLKSVILHSIGYKNSDHENYSYNFHLLDSQFKINGILKIPNKLYIPARNLYCSYITASTICIINEYKSRNFPVAKNLTIFYKDRCVFLNEEIHNCHYVLEKYYPELEYGTKYYDCVIRQFKLNQ